MSIITINFIIILTEKLDAISHNNWANKFLQDSNNRVFESSETDKKYNWQAGQNELDRDLQISESQKDRDWKSDEAQKDRDAQTALAKLQASLNRHYGGSYGGSGSGSGSGSKRQSGVSENHEYRCLWF